MGKKKRACETEKGAVTQGKIEKIRRRAEGVATLGLLLVAVAMLGPFMSVNSGGSDWLGVFKWIYAAGALIFTLARLVGVNDPNESLRLRRLRRLEFWAGMAFCIGAFFWFYNEKKFEEFPYVGVLSILKDTVVFSLAGAVIQVIASWMVSFRQAKERRERENGSKKENKTAGNGK